MADYEKIYSAGHSRHHTGGASVFKKEEVDISVALKQNAKVQNTLLEQQKHQAVLSDELSTLKAIVRRYQKEIDEMTRERNEDTLVKETMALKAQLDSLKTRIKSLSADKERLERDHLKDVLKMSKLETELKQSKIAAKEATVAPESETKHVEEVELLEKRHKLEVKSIRSEVNMVRNALAALTAMNQRNSDDLEKATKSIKEKDRLLASYSIYRHKLVHHQTEETAINKAEKELAALKAQNDLVSAIPIAYFCVFGNTVNSVAVRFRVYMGSNDALVGAKGFVLCTEPLDSKHDALLKRTVEIDGAAGKTDRTLRFTDLKHGLRYKISAYLLDIASGIKGRPVFLELVADVAPVAPMKPNVTFLGDQDAFQVSFQKEQGKCVNVYHALDVSAPLDLLAELEPSAESFKLGADSKEGTHYFALTYSNDIGESAQSEPVAHQVKYPPVPSSITFTKAQGPNDFHVKFAFTNGLDALAIIRICNPQGDNVEIKPPPSSAKIISYVLKLQPAESVVTIRTQTESIFGQRSAWLENTFEPQKLAPYPLVPLCTIKSPQAVMAFPNVASIQDLANVEKMQFRYFSEVPGNALPETKESPSKTDVKRQPQYTVLDVVPATIEGCFIGDLEKGAVVTVSLRYSSKDGGSWSEWSKGAVTLLAAGIELPSSNGSLSSPKKSLGRPAPTQQQQQSVNVVARSEKNLSTVQQSSANYASSQKPSKSQLGQNMTTMPRKPAEKQQQIQQQIESSKISTANKGKKWSVKNVAAK